MSLIKVTPVTSIIIAIHKNEQNGHTKQALHTVIQICHSNRKNFIFKHSFYFFFYSGAPCGAKLHT